MSSPPIALDLRGLARRYGDIEALAPLDLSAAAGEVIGLVGPNGSGKSTLLRTLVGLIRPSAGSASVAGVPLAGDGLAVRRRATFAPGELAAYLELTGREHLRYLLRGRPRPARRRATELAEHLGLPLGRRVRGYSHGMKRQLLFAAALAPDVPLRVLDEPTEGLDPSKRRQVLELIDEDRRPDRTVLLSSHHLGEVERACDRLLFLDRGRLVADERADDLRTRARRLVRLAWSDTATAERARAALDASGYEVLLARDGRVSLLLDTEDPRPFLRALADARGVPAPARLDYGAPSLEDLYRDVFGVEGV